MAIRSAARWATPVVIGIGGLSTIFGLGVAFGAFRLDVMAFFVQADQVTNNERRIIELERQIEENTLLIIDLQNRMRSHAQVDALRNKQIMQKLNEIN